MPSRPLNLLQVMIYLRLTVDLIRPAFIIPFKSVPPPILASNYERNANWMPDFCYFTKAKSRKRQLQIHHRQKWSKRREGTRKKSRERKRQTTREGRKKDVEFSDVLWFWMWSWSGMMMSMDVLIIRINQGADAWLQYSSGATTCECFS